MASVEKRVREREDGEKPKITWLVRWRDETGRGRKKSFDRKTDAERFRAQVVADMSRGAYVDLSNPVTVAEYARQWIAARPHRPRTARRVKSNVEKHIAETALGPRRLVAVRPSEVQAWAADRSKHLAPSTMVILVRLLRSIFAAAVLDRLIASTPVVRISIPKSVPDRVVPLTVEQVIALADAVDVPPKRGQKPKRYRAMVITQAGLGLRLGELLALRVEDVDFLRRTVRVEWQIAEVTRERVEPKTPRSRRTIPLPQVVAEALSQHIRTVPPADDGTLFHTKTGRPYDHAHYGTRVFGKAVAAVSERAARELAEHQAGQRKAEPLAPLPAGTRPHDLRHHYASVLLAAGESVIAVAERLGHENATLVLTTYGHLMPNSEDHTRKAVDAAWESARSAPEVPQTIESIL